MSAVEIAARQAEFSRIANNAQRVVLSSFDAQRDCLTVFPQTHDRTAVLQFRTFADPHWLECDPGAVRRRYHLPERFALISNWLLPTKNHRLVLEALSRLSPTARRKVHVVCTGDIYDYRNPGFYNDFLSAIHRLGVAPNLSVLGVIPKVEQIQLLRGATAYLQPSLFEGWNTGVEEARMLGKPILLSDIGVHREQAPPGAVFFDPTDPVALALKLEAVFDTPLPGEGAERAALSDYAHLQARFGAEFVSISRGGPGSPA
jgi:glycosyltransferase involved in cell wall biosynthesis